MATLGLGMSARSSPAFGSSRPPLKKNVTWAYFSVSAMWYWRRPAAASTSASTSSGNSLGKATGAGMSGSYSVRHTKPTWGHAPRAKPSKEGSAIARVSSRARSGRKLKNTTASPSRTPRPESATGSTNSSVTPAA